MLVRTNRRFEPPSNLNRAKLIRNQNSVEATGLSSPNLKPVMAVYNCQRQVQSVDKVMFLSKQSILTISWETQQKISPLKLHTISRNCAQVHDIFLLSSAQLLLKSCSTPHHIINFYQVSLVHNHSHIITDANTINLLP